MSQPRDKVEQDAIAADCGLALDADSARALAAAPTPAGDDHAAGQGAGPTEAAGQYVQNGGKGGTERVLSQEEIYSLLGFSLSDLSINDNSGIRAIIDSAMVSYERLPMLEIVFDRLVRLMTTSLRNFTSDNVEVSL